MKAEELTKDEVRYLIYKIYKPRSERKIGLTRLIEKLKQLENFAKTALDRNLICIINSAEQAELVKELNDFEGIVGVHKKGLYVFNEQYCYIGFNNDFWQTLSYADITRAHKLITFTELKNLIS